MVENRLTEYEQDSESVGGVSTIDELQKALQQEMLTQSAKDLTKIEIADKMHRGVFIGYLAPQLQHLNSVFIRLSTFVFDKQKIKSLL